MKPYQCHKVVRAAKITKVFSAFGQVSYEDQGREVVFTPPVPFSTRTPEAGDYVVEYEFGYRSVSPRKVFEDGYTVIGS